MNVYRVETCHPDTPTMLLTYYTVTARSVTQAIEKAKRQIEKALDPRELIRSVIFRERIDD